MSRLNICVVLLTLCGALLAEEQVQDESPKETARFGFLVFDRLRKSFCNTFCVSADTAPYFANVICAAKCPELYLPHSTTPKSVSSSVPPIETTTPAAPKTTTPSKEMSTTTKPTTPKPPPVMMPPPSGR